MGEFKPAPLRKFPNAPDDLVFGLIVLIAANMLSEVISTALFYPNLLGFGKTHIYLVIGFILALCLVAWRVWRFTVIPLMAPDDPKELPYWIPMLGGIQLPNACTKY